MAKQSAYKFRSADTIGAAEAEQDSTFLAEAFVDTGHLDALLDCQIPKCIVLGRTGAGKSALIERLKETEPRVVEIEPETLSLGYISSSTILRSLTELGVRLDVFYKFLWRHVLVVELLRHRFNITDESAKRTFVDWAKDLLKGGQHKKAMQYLEEWDGHFWEETEQRIRELTNRLCDEFKGEMSAQVFDIGASAQWIASCTVEEKEEFRQRGQRIVNKIQMRQLNDILALIDAILDDRQKPYYIVIDRLDEDWVDDDLRYKLIRALVETIRDFRRVRHAKVIVALRLDLLDRVVQQTRDAGFQEEKLETNYLRLSWDRRGLVELLDRRISTLIRRRFAPTKPVTHKDVLPSKIGRSSAADYFLERTLMRPRDVILFFNACIRRGGGKARFTKAIVSEAEGEYSKSRWRSLADEWKSDYPNLLDVGRVLEGRAPVFGFQEFAGDAVQDWALGACVRGFQGEDALSQLTNDFVSGERELNDYCVSLIRVFYKVGIVGLKLRPHEAFAWSLDRRSVSSSEIARSSIRVHPMFWRVLGINTQAE